MIVTPGAYAPTVTQHVVGDPTEDSHHNEIPAFTDRTVVAVAEWSPSSTETHNAGGDEVVADMAIMLSGVTTTEYDEWTCSDGLRYRVSGQPKRFHHPDDGTDITQVNLRRIT